MARTACKEVSLYHPQNLALVLYITRKLLNLQTLCPHSRQEGDKEKVKRAGRLLIRKTISLPEGFCLPLIGENYVMRPLLVARKSRKSTFF